MQQNQSKDFLMNNLITLTELAHPASDLKSSITFGVSMSEGAKSFSCPPFIYYALKAKALIAFGKTDESMLTEKESAAIRLISQSLRAVAKDFYLNLGAQGVDMTSHMSTYLQDSFLRMLLNEPSKPFEIQCVEPATQINVNKAKKNISIPYYLMLRLEVLLGSQQAARKFIHKTTCEIKERLASEGFLTSNGELCKGAEISSWSRKVHNSIMLFLLKMSAVPGVNDLPSMLDVKLIREFKRETR